MSASPCPWCGAATERVRLVAAEVAADHSEALARYVVRRYFVAGREHRELVDERTVRRLEHNARGSTTPLELLVESWALQLLRDALDSGAM